MDTERKESCGKRIRKALTIRNMKQSELCQKTNIPKSAMSQYISDCFEPKQDRIYLIAKALNVSEVWLMGYDVPMERQSFTAKQENQLLKLIEQLTDEETEELSRFVDYLISKRK